MPVLVREPADNRMARRSQGWDNLHSSLLVLLLVILFVPPAESASGVTMQVEPAFGGHFKIGEWLPLRIALANDGPATLVQVRADMQAASGQVTYVAPVELASGARQHFTFYLQPSALTSTIRVRLLQTSTDLGAAGPEWSREFDNQNVGVVAERNVNYIVGALVPRWQAFTVLNRLVLDAGPGDEQPKGARPSPRPVKMIPISLADIPERSEALHTLDALVVSGVDTSELSPGQKKAILAWVRRGGRLILGGGAAAACTLSGMPEELVKNWAAGSAQEVTALGPLAEFVGEDIRVPGPFVVTWAPSNRVLVEHAGHSLLSEKRVEQGYVDYSALDLAASPLDAWAGAPRFWERLLLPGSAYPPGAPQDISPRARQVIFASLAARDLPAREHPSIEGLAILLAMYILLVGPVNYWVLRRMGKIALGWVTIPAMTLVFSGTAFAFALVTNRGDASVNRVSIVVFDENASTPTRTSVGIFAPPGTVYGLTWPSDALVTPVDQADSLAAYGPMVFADARVEIVASPSVQVRATQINDWGVQSFQAEAPVPEGWNIESDLTVDGDHVRGTLVNWMDHPIADATLLIGGRYARWGELVPGKRQSFDLLLEKPTSEPFPSFLVGADAGSTRVARDVEVKRRLVLNYLQSGSFGPSQPPSQPTLFGWMDASPLEVRVTGFRPATRQMSWVIAKLNMQYANPIHLEPGDVPVRLVSHEGTAGLGGLNNQVTVMNGDLVLEFQLPKGLAPLRVKRMALVVQPAGIPPNIDVADRRGEWIRLASLHSGRNELADPGRFVAADGIVRMRLSSKAGEAAGCSTYDLDIEGESGAL